MATTITHTSYAHSIAGMPHGLGLLTTVASLPPKYRSRYLNLKTKSEIPLDLSRKSMSPQLECEVPMAANFTEVYTEPCSDTASQASEEIIEELVQQCRMETEKQTNTTTISTTTITNPKKEQPLLKQEHHPKPMTPPLTPTKKRKFSETLYDNPDNDSQEQTGAKIIKIDNSKLQQSLGENTPAKPIKPLDTAPKTSKTSMSSATTKTNRSNKATRKLKFDEETSSPVSGTIIRPLEDITDGNMQYSNGDIDPKYNIVEITEETKAELAAIKNVIGDYVCKLCRIKFDDAFGLAQHRCACIVLLEYRCPECGKQFNCPANLASHRRWHKPRKDGSVQAINSSSSSAQAKKENRTEKPGKKMEDSDTVFSCQECGKKFKRQAYLKKHQLTHTVKATNVKESPSSTTNPEKQPQEQEIVQELVQQQQQPVQKEAYTTAPLTTHNYNDDQDETMSDYSSTSSTQGYGRLQIIETGLTEEENIAAAALTNLRNCASVIQHTTLAH